MQGCWSTNHPLCERSKQTEALCKNKHINAFIAIFSFETMDESEDKSEDAIHDLMAHIFDVTEADHECLDYENEDKDDDLEPVPIVGHNSSHCAMLHTLTHRIFAPPRLPPLCNFEKF